MHTYSASPRPYRGLDLGLESPQDGTDVGLRVTYSPAHGRWLVVCREHGIVDRERSAATAWGAARMHAFGHAYGTGY